VLGGAPASGAACLAAEPAGRGLRASRGFMGQAPMEPPEVAVPGQGLLSVTAVYGAPRTPGRVAWPYLSWKPHPQGLGPGLRARSRVP
jgi:hypothetical protein